MMEGSKSTKASDSESARLIHHAGRDVLNHFWGFGFFLWSFLPEFVGDQGVGMWLSPDKLQLWSDFLFHIFCLIFLSSNVVRRLAFFFLNPSLYFSSSFPHCIFFLSLTVPFNIWKVDDSNLQCTACWQRLRWRDSWFTDLLQTCRERSLWKSNTGVIAAKILQEMLLYKIWLDRIKVKAYPMPLYPVGTTSDAVQWL